MPINKLLNRTERMKPQRPPRTKTGESRRPRGSSIFFLLPYKSSTVPTPPGNTYCDNCSTARTWKEERKRLMKMNKISSPHPGTMGAKTSPFPGTYTTVTLQVPASAFGTSNAPTSEFNSSQVPKDQIWDFIKGMPLLAPRDSSQLGKDREQP